MGGKDGREEAPAAGRRAGQARRPFWVISPPFLPLPQARRSRSRGWPSSGCERSPQEGAAAGVPASREGTNGRGEEVRRRGRAGEEPKRAAEPDLNGGKSWARRNARGRDCHGPALTAHPTPLVRGLPKAPSRPLSSSSSSCLPHPTFAAAPCRPCCSAPRCSRMDADTDWGSTPPPPAQPAPLLASPSSLLHAARRFREPPLQQQQQQEPPPLLPPSEQLLGALAASP